MYFVGVERDKQYTSLIAVNSHYKSKTFIRLFAERLVLTTPRIETIFVLQSYPQKLCELTSDELLDYCLDHYFLAVSNT